MVGRAPEPVPAFVVYAFRGCRWCRAASNVLRRLGAEVLVHQVTPAGMRDIVRPHRVPATAPQVFCYDMATGRRGRRIGGFEDLLRYLGLAVPAAA